MTLYCLIGSIQFPQVSVFIPIFPIVENHHFFVFGKPQEQFIWRQGYVSLLVIFVPASSDCAIFQQELPLPAAETLEHRRVGRRGSGSITALHVTVSKLTPNMRGKLLTPSYSHGPLAPCFSCSAEPLPSEITGTCTGEVAAGWPKQRAEASKKCSIGGRGAR